MGGSIPPPGFGFGCCCCSRATCNRPCLLCVRLWCYAPYRRRSECAVRCFRCLWVWGVLVALIKLAGFLVGLRLRASPSGFAFGPARSHDSTQNPWANARGRSRIHPPTAHRGRICRGTPPCGVLERFLFCTCCASPHGTLGAEHFLVVCFVGANDAGAASGGHLTFGRLPSVGLLVMWEAAVSLGLVDLSRIPSGAFFREAHPGSEMASQNYQNTRRELRRFWLICAKP